MRTKHSCPNDHSPSMKASRSTSTQSDGSCAKATSALQHRSRLPGRYCIPPVFARVVGQYRRSWPR